MAGKDEGRFAALETDNANMKSVVLELKDYMKESSKTRQANHNEIIQRLSVIETSQKGFQSYQESCDDDRKKLTDRVTSIERGESRQAGRSGIISVMISTSIASLVAILAAIIGKH